MWLTPSLDGSLGPGRFHVFLKLSPGLGAMMQALVAPIG